MYMLWNMVTYSVQNNVIIKRKFGYINVLCKEKYLCRKYLHFNLNVTIISVNGVLITSILLQRYLQLHLTKRAFV